MAKPRATPQRKAKEDVESVHKTSDDESNADSPPKHELKKRLSQRLQKTAGSAGEESGSEADKESAPAKLRTTAQRKSKQNVEGAEKSSEGAEKASDGAEKASDGESNASSTLKRKRKRTSQPQQNTADNDSEETGSEADKEESGGENAEDAENAEDDPSAETATRSPSKRLRKKSVDYTYEIPSDSSNSNASSVAKRRSQRTPRRKMYARGTSTKSSPSTSAYNGSARTAAKRGRPAAGDDRNPALIHALKINTAMMGDLAAELRLFRETLSAMNRGR